MKLILITLNLDYNNHPRERDYKHRKNYLSRTAISKNSSESNIKNDKIAPNCILSPMNYQRVKKIQKLNSLHLLFRRHLKRKRFKLFANIIEVSSLLLLKKTKTSSRMKHATIKDGPQLILLRIVKPYQLASKEFLAKSKRFSKNFAFKKTQHF